MPLAVHRTLRQRFADADDEWRIFEPRERHVIRQPRVSHIRQESINLGMRSVGVALQIVEGLEILWFAEMRIRSSVHQQAK